MRTFMSSLPLNTYSPSPLNLTDDTLPSSGRVRQTYGESIRCLDAPLHPLCVVHLSAMATVVGEDTHRPVVGAGDELPPRRRVVDVHDGLRTVLV